MRRMIERWREVGWLILLAALLVAGTIGSGLVLTHAGAGTAMPAANPPSPAGEAGTPAPGAATDFAVGLDPTGAPILLP